MLITKIQKQVKSDQRFNIYLDGTYYCALTAETIVKAGLKEGLNVDKDYIDSLQFESEKQTALTKTVNYLGKKLKTKKELITYLKSKGYVDSIIEYVLDMLSQYGYVDDKNYSTSYIKTNKNQKGKKWLAMNLKQKGVAENIIDESLDQIESETETVIALATKYLKNKEKTQETAQKLYRFLYARGFGNDDIMYAIKTLIKDIEQWK